MSFKSFLKKKGVNVPTEDRIDKGQCAFCTEHVFVAVGQLYTNYRGRPTHKKCRRMKLRGFSTI